MDCQDFDFKLKWNSDDEDQEQQEKEKEKEKERFRTIQPELKEKIEALYPEISPIRIISQTENSVVVYCKDLQNQVQGYALKVSHYPNKTAQAIKQKIGKHSNIVQILLQKQGTYLMPYYQKTLADLLREAQPYFLDLQLAATLCLQISGALAFLHSKGIVHGDITPANILCSNTNNNSSELIFYLSDFGNSFINFSEIPTQTLPYRAPEQRQISSSADIWGLGCIIFECMTSTPLIPSQIDQEQFQDAIKIFAKPDRLQMEIQRFSIEAYKKVFKEFLLVEMLQMNPQKRATAQKVNDWIKEKNMLL